MSARDVIVLGAGVIGAAVAFEVSRAGHRVRVIDARAPGRGATQASAGVLSPYIEGHDSEALTVLGRHSLDLYDDFVARVAATCARPILYARTGTIEVALDAEDAERLRRAAARLLSGGVAVQWLEGAAVVNEEPAVSSAAVSAIVAPMHGFVGVVDLTNALVEAASRQGAIFENGTRALRVERHGAALRVHTDAGQWEAERVVMAAGSWAGQIDAVSAVAAPVRPIRGQLLVLRLPHAVMKRVVWGRDCYIVPWPDGTVLVGATVEDVGFDERATVTGVAGLLRAAQVLVPALREAAFDGVRVGLRPAGPDELPMIGASSHVPGLVYACGHYRNGALLAPITAQLVRDLVDETASDPVLRLVSPARAGL